MKQLPLTAAILKITVLILGMGLHTALGADAPVDAINPLSGASTSTSAGRSTHGLGKTFPGAATPFGMVQLSPDTITGGDNGPGYSYHQDTIEGFSFTHMSGIGWYGDLGNFQVMPTTGPLEIDREKAKSPYQHDDETAKAGYYAVGLKRYGIRVELTAAPRAGILRFTYPASETSRIQIDLARRIGMNGRWIEHGKQHIDVVDDHTIEGWMECPSADGGWGHGEGNVSYTHYFHAEFSKPIAKSGIWDKDRIVGEKMSYEGHNVGFYLEFPTTAGEQVLMKSGVSYVSVEGARKNLEHDIPAWDFEGVRDSARSLWADVLDRAAIEGGTPEDRTVFATALYHAFIDPRGVSDVDDWYIGADGKKHQADDFVYRSVFSGWDVFRSEFPMLNLLRPDVVNDEVNSLVQIAGLSGKGYLPRWELMGSHTGCMIGDPAVAVIGSAWQAGIRKYDTARAYIAVRNSVLGDKNTRQPDYAKLGYATDGAGLSKTLEYAYFDSAAARLAASLGKSEDAAVLTASSMNYRKIYSEEVSNMRARLPDGSWLPWEGRTMQGQNCVESNPYQQGWFVPHDVNGLINLMGGQKRCLDLLEPFFDKVPEDFLWNDNYNHANEPVHHVPYLFPYLGKPWLTQKWARRIMDKAYGPDVMGLVGNEDVGQMSAWFVLSAAGLHPVDPASGIHIIGSPLFTRMTLKLDAAYYPGKTFIISAVNNSPENIYIQSAELNGKPFDRPWIAHSEIVQGGTLEFTMGPKPNTAWGMDPAGKLPSLSPRFSCAKASVRAAGGDRYVISATIQGVGGERKAEFPVAVYEGAKNLGSVPVAVAPGETVDVEIPFSSSGSATEVTVLGTSISMPGTAWEKQSVTPDFLTEGAAVGDIDGDGTKDLVAGAFWFKGPDFKERVRFSPGGAVEPTVYQEDSFLSWVEDFNGDGKNDILVASHPGKHLTLFLNPDPGATGDWPAHVVMTEAASECPTLADLDGDGKNEFVCMQGGKFGYARPDPADVALAWKFTAISEKRTDTPYVHGLGVGDVNGDDRPDILAKDGWFEQPAHADGTWEWHAVEFAGPGGSQMLVFDADGDGDNDVVTSLNAHGYGLAWYENRKSPEDAVTFTRHEILPEDPVKSGEGGLQFSQLHSLAAADFDGDGRMDFVTGKRFFAHNGHDPGAKDPALTVIFLNRKDGDTVHWLPQVIHPDTGAGCQILAVDLDGDHHPEVVVGNKKGVAILRKGK